MGIDAMRISVQIRRFLVISFRLCYRSVCKHPFLVGMFCYLLLLYRSFPFLFSLLVSASPVLICTAILLGTLLSFGEPNIPEIEKEKEEEGQEEVSHEISSLKKEGVVENATFVVQKDESFRFERFVGNRNIEEESLVENNNRMIEGHGDLGDYVPLIDETLREVQFEKQVIEEAKSDFDNLESGKTREIQEENLGIKEVLNYEEGAEDQYFLLQNLRDENLEDDNSVGEFIESQNGYLEFSQESSWKRANHDDEEDDDEASDSGSDGAESSSPDASMADILPMLDELHPLLDEEAPQPAHISHDGSDAGSEGSQKSDESSLESEEDMENQEDEDGNDDNDNEEEAQGSKEDESKSAIKWTEDDQKNLMDLGTLELERNQRLESLIARRRARRTVRLMAEKNLIDLDAADLPINVPSISTARHNPFDFPNDDVPGSAPSVLLPRRNPFDLPYDSNEEKPDLKGDSFQQEFSATQHREPFFRRNESFSVGPSTLGGARQERQDLRWKPYFVPEQSTTEATSYHTFQRQLSEASDSKVSSVPDSESVSSALEEEDKRINEVDVSHETEMISNVDHASLLVELGSLSSEEADSVDDEQVEEGDFHHDGAEITPGDVENHHEVDSGLSESERATPEELNPSEILLRMGPGEEDYSSRSSLSSLSEIDEKISDVKRGSTSLEPANFQIEGSRISTQTSLDSDFHFVSGLADDNEHREPILESRNDHIDKCDILTQSSLDSDFHFTSRMMDESLLREPALESTGNQIGDSGILKESSLESDLYGMSGLADDNKEHVSDPRGHHNVESGISSQTSHNSDFHLTTAVVDDGQHSDPVYDSSPPSIETFLSFSSVSSDAHRSEMGSPLAMAEDKESEARVESLEKDTSSYKEMLEGSSQAHSPDESKIRSAGVTENTGDEITELGLSGVDSNFDGQNRVMKPESAVENVSVDSPPSLSDDGSAEEVVAYKEESSHHKQDQVHSLSLDTEIIVDGNKQLDSTSSSYQMASEERNLPVLEKDYPPLVVEQVSADTELSASEAKPVKEHAIVTEKSLGLEQDQVNSPSFDVDIHVDGFQAVGETLDLVDSNSQHVPSNDLHLSALEERQPAVVAEQVLGNHLDVSSSKIKHVEEHSLEKGETIQFKENQAHLSSSDLAIVAGFHQDEDLTVVSSDSGHQNPLSGEKSHVELEKQRSLSDKSMLKPQELSVTISDNKNILEVYDPEEKTSSNTTSLMSDFTSDSPDSLEYKSPDGGMNLKDDVLDKIVYEDCHQDLEHSNSPGEAYGPPVAEENVNEEEDEIKEIDEGLLSELDAVGDFSVKEVVGKSLNDEQVPENTSVSPEFIFLPKDLSQTEVKPELPVLEVRSVEDIDLAFKQLHEGVNVEEVILPSMVEEQLAEDESKHQTDSDLRVVEARSLEDIHVAMKQVSEENIEELVDSRDATEEINDLGSTKEIPVLEVKTIEDIDLAFRQLHEGVEVEEVILPSAIKQQLVVDDTKDLGQTCSGLPVVEARSLEDIHIAMKLVSEGKTEELPNLLDPNDKPGHEAASIKEIDSRDSQINDEDTTESSTVEVTDVNSSKAVESSTVQVIEVASIKEREPSTTEFGVGETSTIALHEPEHGFDEASGNSSSSIPDTKGGKAKFNSSSSSSSSSDSD